MRAINQTAKHCKNNKIIHFLQASIFIGGIFLFLFNNTSALEYQSNTNVQFTLNPTISIAISDNLAIDNLSPGTASDSNIINVNVATNNVTGYTLSATVGNSTSPNNELTHIANDTYKFTSTSTDVTELTNLEPNTWGYNYSTNNGTTWHDYSTLPLYNTTGTTLNYKNNTSNDNVKFKIGAKASNTQAAGTYTNTINFTATANPETHYYIQDFTLSQCEQLTINDDFTVYDKRDESDYTVRYINGQCWMTQNLHYDFNTAPASGGCPTRERGCYYTWENALDSCPANWVLPTKTDFENLISIYDTNEKLATAPFSGVYGGYYETKSPPDFRLVGTYMLYWSSTTNPNDSISAYGFRSYVGATDIESTYKRLPRPIRCLRSS